MESKMSTITIDLKTIELYMVLCVTTIPFQISQATNVYSSRYILT